MQRSDTCRHLSYHKQNSGPLPEETPQLVDAARPAHANQDLGCTLLPRRNHSRTSQAGSLDMLHLRPPSSRQFHSRPPIPMAPRHATLPAPAPAAATSTLRSLGQQQRPSRTCSLSPSWSQQQHSHQVSQLTFRKSSHGGGGGREQGGGLGASPQAHPTPALPTHVSSSFSTFAANGDASALEGGGGDVGMAGQGSWATLTPLSAPKQEQLMLALPTTTRVPRSPVNKVTSVSAVLSKSLALLGSQSAVPERGLEAVPESNQKQAAGPEATSKELRLDCRTQPQMSEIVVEPQVHFESCPGRVRRGQDNKRAGTIPGTQPSPYLTALAAALPICQLGGAKSRLPVHAPVVPRNAVRPTPFPEVTAARPPCDLARALMYELGVTSVQITVKPMAMPSGRRLLLVVQGHEPFCFFPGPFFCLALPFRFFLANTRCALRRAVAFSSNLGSRENTQWCDATFVGLWATFVVRCAVSPCPCRQFHSRPPIPMAPRHATLHAPAPAAATSNLRSLGRMQSRCDPGAFMQEDVSETAAMEHMLADLAESQLTMASQIFPKHIIEYMATSGPSFGPQQVAGLARQHHHVTILFMDIVGFTSMSKEVPPEAVMAFLNTLFGHFDNLCDKHGVLKLETAGDCYIVAGGITSPTLHGDDGQGSTKGGAADEFNTVVDSHDVQLSAARVLAFAKDMLAVSRVVVFSHALLQLTGLMPGVVQVLMPHNQQPVVVRVGLHTGDCVSGLIGTKVPKFAVFGDSMNTASRMESTCAPMRIQASKPTASLLPEEPWEATGGIEVKGKGLMETFIWGGQLPDFSLASQPAQPAPWGTQTTYPPPGPTTLPSPTPTALSSGSLARLSGAARAPSLPRSSPADSLMHLSTSSLPPGNIAWATASNPVPGSGSLLPDPATIAAGTQSHDANVQRFHSLASWQLDSLISAPGSCHAEGDASARSRQPVNAEWNDATEIMLPFPTRGVADNAQRTTPNLGQASAAAAALRQWSVHQMVSLPPWQHPLLTIAESVMGSQDTGHDCSQDMAPRGCEPSMQRRSERQMGGDSNSRSPLAQSPAQPSYLSSNPVFNVSPQHTHEATPCEVLGGEAPKLRSIVEFDGEEASAGSNNSHRSSAALATVSVPIPVTEARPNEVLATAVPTPTQRREPHPATASAPSPVAQRAVHGIAHIEVSEESGAQSAAKTTGDQGRPADSVIGSLASETGWAVGFGCNPADWAVEPQARGQQSLQEVRTRTTPAVSPRLSASPLLKAATASADQWLAAMSAASHDMYAERASQSSAIAGSRHSQDFMSCLSWATRKTEQAQGEASSSLSGLIGFLDEKSDIWRSAFPSPVVPQAGPASGDQEQRDPPSTLSLPAIARGKPGKKVRQTPSDQRQMTIQMALGRYHRIVDIFDVDISAFTC
ncbi:hypothetical protein QJQ45_021443 [Haematococcus lacustris]|nr:hypothetical protein QJQ45_021443 [Haematococcus lacustris]